MKHNPKEPRLKSLDTGHGLRPLPEPDRVKAHETVRKEHANRMKAEDLRDAALCIAAFIAIHAVLGLAVLLACK